MKLPTIRRLPSGNYFCQLRLDGKSISITEPTEEKCRAKAMAYKTGVLSARSAPQAISLGAACDAYIAARQGVRSPTTIDTYRKIRAQYFQGLMATRLGQITERSLALAVQRECNRPSRRGGKLSPKTIHAALGFIRCVLNENGVQLGRVSAPEVKRRVIRLPEPGAVLRAIVGSEIELPCLLSAWLSLSMSELRGLTKSKSIMDGKLYVVETLVRVKTGEKKDAAGKTHGVYTDIRKEGGKEELRTRALDIPPYLQRLIDQVDGDILVPWSVRQLERRFQHLIAAAGLPAMTFHQLRHLNASVMAMLGVQKEVARERGGWKTNYVMDSVYTHVFTDARQAADQKIDAYFAGQIANESLTNPPKRRVYRLLKR